MQTYMMFATDRAFEVGQRVTFVEAPQELLAGLAPEDQRAIRSLVGKPGIFEGIDPHGYVEIEFARRMPGNLIAPLNTVIASDRSTAARDWVKLIGDKLAGEAVQG